MDPRPPQKGRLTSTQTGARRPGRTWVSVSYFALLAGVAVAFAAPEIAVRRATEQARACLAKAETPRGPELPDCRPILRDLAWPAKITATEHDATYRIEELRGRVAMSRYVDAQVGHPDPAARAERALLVKDAQEMMDAGSRRVSLDELGPTVVAPHMGKLAALYGDRLTLVDHFEYYGLWHTRKDALEAAIVLADWEEVDRIAHQLAEWHVREADLRSATGAALCITNPSEGLAVLSAIPAVRAEKRYANIQRDYGEVFAAARACAAKAMLPPPEKPTSYSAGVLDALTQNALTELRLGALSGDVEEALRDAKSLLAGTEPLPPRGRALLLAAVIALGAAPPPLDDLAAWSTIAAGEPALAPSLLRVGALLAEGPGLTPVAPTEWLERASASLEARAEGESAAETKKKLRQLAGDLAIQAGLDHARAGLVVEAEAATARAATLLGSSPVGRALSMASAVYVAGDPRRALELVEAAPFASEKDPRIGDAARTLQALLLARSGKAAGATELAAALPLPDVAGAVDELAVEAAWVRLALAPESALGVDRKGFGSYGDLVWQGMADSERRYLTLGAPFVRAQIASVAEALTSGAEQRRAHRYRQLSTRGDMLALGIPLMVAADRLLGAEYDGPAHEVWLDALTTIDSRRIRVRSYAFMRMEAAAIRGDGESEALWRERLAVSRRVANAPEDLEAARLLRL
jgi:hypothetical protein